MRLPLKELFRAKSILYLLKLVFVIVICCFVAASAVYLFYTRTIAVEYGRQINNIGLANMLSRVAREEVAKESWYIVAGRQSFGESDIYERIEGFLVNLGALYDNTAASERELVEAAIRATGTLRGYVDQLREQCDNDMPISARQMTLTEIYKVSGNISDALQEFANAQITGIARANVQTQRSAIRNTALLALLSLAVVFVAVVAYGLLKDAVARPNMEIAAMADRILEGDLQTEVPPPGMEELDHLADTINLMSRRIRALLENSIEEQKNLQKAELRALQAQITPHFLYNTLETIVWLAEGGYNEDVVDVTIAFSNYYRIALSQGKDFIAVGEEVEHVRDYLVIQRMRYKDILSYTIDIDPLMREKKMLKLLLQPLVENALYHGIKNKRDGGRIAVTGRLREDGSLYFEISDDGIGMTEEQQERLRRGLASENMPEQSGYGLYNVNRRLRLFYGEASLGIESEYGKGTKVHYVLPDQRGEQ